MSGHMNAPDAASGFAADQAARVLEPGRLIRPRLMSLFEPVPLAPAPVDVPSSEFPGREPVSLPPAHRLDSRPEVPPETAAPADVEVPLQKPELAARAAPPPLPDSSPTVVWSRPPLQTAGAPKPTTPAPSTEAPLAVAADHEPPPPAPGELPEPPYDASPSPADAPRPTEHPGPPAPPDRPDTATHVPTRRLTRPQSEPAPLQLPVGRHEFQGPAAITGLLPTDSTALTSRTPSPLPQPHTQPEPPAEHTSAPRSIQPDATATRPSAPRTITPTVTPARSTPVPNVSATAPTIHVTIDHLDVRPSTPPPPAPQPHPPLPPWQPPVMTMTDYLDRRRDRGRT